MLQPTSPTSAALADQPEAKQDRLDFTPYAATIADIILHPDTGTPLTIGIFGSWGSGKTSLMKMVERRLRDAAEGAEPGSMRLTYPLWFNAWLYSKEEALWRALVARVIQALQEMPLPEDAQMPPDQKRARTEKLQEVAAQLYRTVEPSEFGSLSIVASEMVKQGGDHGSAEITLTLQQGLELLEQVAVAGQEGVAQGAQALRSQVRRATTALESRRMQSLERFQQQFSDLIETYVAPFGYLIIFVDDLDRCLPDKAVEVLEAIKLFLDVPGCIFILGIDREVIERGIRLRYGELAGAAGTPTSLPLLLNLESLTGSNRVDPLDVRAFMEKLVEERDDVIQGGRYLEKIIQLPFSLPPISPAALFRFTDSLMPNAPHPQCVRVFAAGLEANPRQIKRALNIFALLWQLTQHRAELRGKIAPVRLAKMVVIQQRHPELYEQFCANPLLLVEWERALRQRDEADAFAAWEQARGGEPVARQPVPRELELYDHFDAFRALLLLHPLMGTLSADANFVDLTPDQAQGYVFLTGTVTDAGPTTNISNVPVYESIAPTARHTDAIVVGSGLDVQTFEYLRLTPFRMVDPVLVTEIPPDGLSAEAREALWRVVANAGGDFYATLEGALSSRGVDDSVQRAKESDGTLLQVAVRENEGQLPWELVYDGAVKAQFEGNKVLPPDEVLVVKPDRFWGLRHIIERPLLTPAQESNLPANEDTLNIVIVDRPRILVALAPDAPNARETRGQWDEWQNAGLVEVRIVDNLPELRTVWQTEPFQAVVLHPSFNPSQDDPQVVFGSERLNSRLLQSWGLPAPTWGANPPGTHLVILDASGPFARGTEWASWVELLYSMGAKAVVAPLAAIPPSLAAPFMAAFFPALLNGQPVGQALQAARWALVDERGSPHGLFYALFGPTDTQLPAREMAQSAA